MWNNITHGNTNMNRFERLMEHKGHLERLAQIKKVINTKNPKTPSFISKKMINPGSRMERALKIHYENQVIYNRMYDISNKKSPYSACMNIPSKCPAYDLLTHHRLRKNYTIKTENEKLFKRFAFARPTYNVQKLDQEYEYSKYLENNISKNRNRINPNLEFISFEKFNEKIRNRSFYGKIKKLKSNNISLNDSFEKAQSCYSTRKSLMPSLTVNHNVNEEWFKKSQFDNNINNIGNIESPKMKRPNSCKPNIVINRELQEASDIFNSEPGYNVSYKTYKTKPASGKTRTNGSYSTNVMTSP
jgi:hypothetical protein